MRTKLFAKENTLKKLFLIIVIIKLCGADVGDVCDRRPLGSKTEALPSDNRFKIDIIGIYGNKYIPKKLYQVKLYSSDNTSTFVAFTISALADTKYNEKNPRKPTLLDPGSINPSPDSDTLPSPNCKNSVIQSDITPKTSVLASWLAPPKDNKCVTIYAVLAVKRDVWYDYGGPLSKRVCEDRRNVEDMPPLANNNCKVCEDARYLLTFEGTWSYNTHPYMFPKSESLARFSDVVGASHSINYSIYKDNSDASEGLTALAEQGNTTKLEKEILSKLGSSVRTLIKATGPPKPNMTTNAIFRVTQEHHLVSIVTAILPSPDWFLGVSSMELCDISNKWAEKLTLNIYPMDAGSDSGLTFESANEGALPPQPISSAAINSSIPKEDVKPFAKLHFELMRTYPKLECIAEQTASLPEEEKDTAPDRPAESHETATSERPIETPTVTDSESSEECPISQWQEWSPCDGGSDEGEVMGHRWRERYHLVDGEAVEKYDPDGDPSTKKEVPESCKDRYETFETSECKIEEPGENGEN